MANPDVCDSQPRNDNALDSLTSTGAAARYRTEFMEKSISPDVAVVGPCGDGSVGRGTLILVLENKFRMPLCSL